MNNLTPGAKKYYEMLISSGPHRSPKISPSDQLLATLFLEQEERKKSEGSFLNR